MSSDFGAWEGDRHADYTRSLLQRVTDAVRYGGDIRKAVTRAELWHTERDIADAVTLGCHLRTDDKATAMVYDEPPSDRMSHLLEENLAYLGDFATGADYVCDDAGALAYEYHVPLNRVSERIAEFTAESHA